MPKKMRRAALRSALSVKAGAGQIAVVDGLAMDEPKTKAAVTMLEALELGGQRVLLVLGSKNMPVERSFANLPNTKSVLSSYLNVRDLLGHDTLLFSKEAIELVESG